MIVTPHEINLALYFLATMVNRKKYKTKYSGLYTVFAWGKIVWSVLFSGGVHLFLTLLKFYNFSGHLEKKTKAQRHLTAN